MFVGKGGDIISIDYVFLGVLNLVIFGLILLLSFIKILVDR